MKRNPAVLLLVTRVIPPFTRALILRNFLLRLLTAFPFRSRHRKQSARSTRGLLTGRTMNATIFSIAIILLHGPTALADGDGNVQVLEPMTKIVSSTAELEAACAGVGKYDACTRMIAYRIEAACTSDGGEWRMDATASFRPWIILRKLQSLSHEHEHVEDIRRAATRHILGLEDLRFGSAEECRARTLAENAGFAETMRQFALDSNLARHPQLRMLARK